ncbi:MAG: hypothetical protein AAF281_00070 [Pseudomonadota bacterium]
MRLHCLVALLLAGCTAVDPVTALRLSTVDPLTADPAGYAVALDLPAGLDIRPDSAFLTLRATRADTGETAERAFALIAGDVDTYALDRADLPRFRALQSRIKAWQAAAPEATSGSLSVAVGGCRRGLGPAADARVGVRLRTRPGDAFLPLLRDAPLDRLLGAAAGRGLPACDGPI